MLRSAENDKLLNIPIVFRPFKFGFSLKEQDQRFCFVNVVFWCVFFHLFIIIDLYEKKNTVISKKSTSALI